MQKSSYNTDTGGKVIADLEFFGNPRLPVAFEQATLTVTYQGGDVSSSFDWIYQPDSEETEAMGIRVKDLVDLSSGAYTVTVNYCNLSKNFEFYVDKSVSLENTSASVTQQNATYQEIEFAWGTAWNFNETILYTLSWIGEETDLDINDYFTVDFDRIPDTFNWRFSLIYKGGLTAREDVYGFHVTVSDDQGRMDTADFTSLTVLAPSIDLSPDRGFITIGTSSAELATITTSDFYDEGNLTWKFILEDCRDRDHFTVENNKLIYTGNGQLPDGTFSLEVIGSDGYDTASFMYELVIQEYLLVIDPRSSSISKNAHDLELATITPDHFPAGEIEYTLSWERNEDINQYFSIIPDPISGTSKILYSAGLAVGDYSITVNAYCVPDDPSEEIINIDAAYDLSVTSPGYKESIVLDPDKKEIALTEAIDQYELASVECNHFDETPTFSVSATNTTTKGEIVDFSNCFAYDSVHGKLIIVQNSETEILVSGEYSITINAKTVSTKGIVIQSADATFVLTLYDKKVDTENYINITIDFNPDDQKFIVQDTATKELIDEDEANVLIVSMDTATTPTITITQEAMNNLDAIQIDTTEANTIIVKSISDPEPEIPVANQYTISDSSGTSGVSLIASIVKEEEITQIAKTTSVNTKSITITSNQETPTTYNINALSTNLTIDSNLDDVISFAEGTSTQGVVLNLDNTDYYQSVYTGQGGTLKLENSVSIVELSPGNDIITGSSNGSVIVDESSSWNTITLKGDENTTNQVTLNGGSNITVDGSAKTILNVNENGDKSVINLTKASGEITAEIKGNNVSISGGTKIKEITLIGDYGIINSPESTENMKIHIQGNGAIVKTGNGNDEITIEGNDSLVNTGGGDDIIYIIGESSGNSISTGAGDDIVISTSTGGNTIHSNSGNDFIIGGPGRDRIFGGTGNSLLAGGGGSDRIIGGSSRDIMMANVSSNLKGKNNNELIQIRNRIFKDNEWWNDIDYALDVLGDQSESDGVIDSLSRNSETGIDIFFRNLLEGDTVSNNLQGDRIID